MVYNTQNCWVFGLCSPSSILENRKHSVSETGSVSETLCLLVSRILDDGQSPKTQQFWGIYVCTSLSTELIRCSTYCMQNTSIFQIQSCVRFFHTEGVTIFRGSYYEWRCLPPELLFPCPVFRLSSRSWETCTGSEYLSVHACVSDLCLSP
jgi:hypothetical protein